MNLANVDLNLLVALDALLAERNVTRAASRLGMTQPGMSNALGRLRRMFDDPLLVRQGRTFVLTSQAQALVEPIAAILAEIRHTLEDRQDFDSARDTRNFTVSASDYATLVLIGPLVRRIAMDAPGITIHVCPRAPDATTLLQSDEVDMVIEPEELMQDSRFPSQRLLEDRWLSAIWADNPEVGRTMTLETFLRLPHLVYSIGSAHALALPDQHLQDIGIQRRIEFSVESFLLAPFLLRGTTLTTLVPERAKPALQAAADIRLLKPPVPVPNFTERLWWHPRHNGDPGHAWLRARFADVVAALRRPDDRDCRNSGSSD